MRTIFTVAAVPALVAVLAWSPAVMAQQKTARQCRDEWRADKAAIAASGRTQRAFIAECRGIAPPATATAPELAKGQYASEADAKTSCGTEPVVWVNRLSRVYHESSSKNYGATRVGAYMCEKDSIAAGFRPPRPARGAAKPDAKPAST
jgi:hypothetical protein